MQASKLMYQALLDVAQLLQKDSSGTEVDDNTWGVLHAKIYEAINAYQIETQVGVMKAEGKKEKTGRIENARRSYVSTR